MMMFILALSGNCTDPGLASLLAIAKKFMNILWIVGPILAIIGAGIAFYKLMSNPDEKKYKSLFKNMLIALIMLFLIPAIVNAVMRLFDGKFDVASCWNQAEVIYETSSQDSHYIDPNGNMSLYFNYTDKWVTLGGHSTQTTFDDFYTTLDTLSMNVPLKVGLTDDSKIFVQSSNPYMHITDIQGAYVDESQLRKIINRFGLCFYLGWGIQYGVINQKFDTGPQLGAGIYYRIW